MMIVTFFIVGMLTSLGCGFMVCSTSRTTGLHELAWILGGAIGAAMMLAAIYIERIDLC